MRRPSFWEMVSVNKYYFLSLEVWVRSPTGNKIYQFKLK